MAVFRDVLVDYQLIDIGYKGVWYTWSRGNLAEKNIRERIDTVVANASQRELFPFALVSHLPNSFSDHFPLLVHVEKEAFHPPHMSFYFESWWVLEESFYDEVRRLWSSTSGDLLCKIDCVRHGLGLWVANRKHCRYGLKQQLTKDLEELIQEGATNNHLFELIDKRIQLNLEIDKDELYWEQQVRTNWLKVSYKNSKFFHHYVSCKKKRNSILSQRDHNGRITFEKGKMEVIAW